jgi:PAS domain S-box-containing protein
MTITHTFSDDSLPAQPEVLLVDDDDVNLLLIALALRERGFKIIEAESGERALAMLAELTPDIIVLDAMMPGLDGFDTCRAVRRLPGYENVPVLMLTGLDDDASITRAYQAGATDFFVKTTQWSLLAGRLQYLLRASRTRIELERSKSKLARAQDLARMGSFDWWRSSGGLLMSAEALRVLGYGPQEVATLRTLLRMVPTDERRVFMRQMHDALRHSKLLASDVTIQLLDGRQRIIHIEAEPEFNDHGHGAGYSGILQDVTDRRQAEDKIRQLANFDALTGLPNRRQLIWRAEKALEQARRMQHQMALLLIDLDRFKIINDTLGHSAGDELLMEVGRRLRACVRHSDQLMEGALEAVGARSHRALEAVGRLGGDEFVALLPEVTSDRDAERVAWRILEVLREPIFVSGQECFVTASVGVAIFPRDGNSVVDLLRNSDVAMYSAKAQGKNASAIYSPQLAGRGRDKLELETALHKAIERDELVLHYQPKVDVRSARMVGAEALMRWQRGERAGAACGFHPAGRGHRPDRPPVRMGAARGGPPGPAMAGGVWLHRLDRGQPAQPPVRAQRPGRTHPPVRHAVRRAASRDPARDHRDNLMKELQNVIPSLHRLNEIGVEISIDDFGTGYSSLAYLTTLPISELKIDRSFVRELGITPQSSAVVTAIIALARSLGLRVVAEGVESLRQMEVLHRLGCTVMQGFLFSRGVMPDELQRWLEQTVLPRKAPWIGSAEDPGEMGGSARTVGGRPYR